MTIGFATTRNCNEDFPRVEQFGAPSERERERERKREREREREREGGSKITRKRMGQITQSCVCV